MSADPYVAHLGPNLAYCFHHDTAHTTEATGDGGGTGKGVEVGALEFADVPIKEVLKKTVLHGNWRPALIYSLSHPQISKSPYFSSSAD